MTVITSFTERLRKKEIQLERSLLKELSIQNLQNSIRMYFGTIHLFGNVLMDDPGFEDACFDVGIESYLLGGRYSKFGFYGEDTNVVKNRCQHEIEYLTDTLYHFWLYWWKIGVADNVDESTFYNCSQFVDYWWNEGYSQGKKRLKLRLH
ncbi:MULTISPECIES: DUF2521 family protein [Bacillus]|uniref:DUF2521 family protein n=2 Tax=Bacillaceae TaxID=186817 RepID=UPI00065DF694|nr:DUF2521 family protein [Bacillus smithii]AKP45561.1 YbxH [Bacillus smithii]MED0660355.1 DUF2521 family protein [Bacillus smithii]MED4884030.1 DUF2521 family protein [Bacillus smithii]